MKTLHHVLEESESLTLAEKEELVFLLQRYIVEEKREVLKKSIDGRMLTQ